MSSWTTINPHKGTGYKGDWSFNTLEYAMEAGLTWTNRDVLSLQNLVVQVVNDSVNRTKKGSDGRNMMLSELSLLKEAYYNSHSLLDWSKILELYLANGRSAAAVNEAAVKVYNQHLLDGGMLNGVYVPDLQQVDIDPSDGLFGLMEWKNVVDSSATPINAGTGKTMHQVYDEYEDNLSAKAEKDTATGSVAGVLGSSSWMWLLAALGVVVILLYKRK